MTDGRSDDADARTDAKPSGHGKPIAILSLEIYDGGAGIDRDTTRAAAEMTAALRDRARVGTGPYMLAPGSEKGLKEEKSRNHCESEASTCMAAIGSELGVEVLLYGRIWVDKAAPRGQGTYKVSLKLLDVARKQLTISLVETLPIAESIGGKASAHARAWCDKLVGAAISGAPP